MVLESMLEPMSAEKRPLNVLIIAFLYTIIAIVAANQLFPAQSSILAVALVTMLFVPLFQKIFILEEKRDLVKGENIFVRHREVITVFSAFFLGSILAVSFVFIFFNSQFGNVFFLQKDWFIRQGMIATGNVVGFSDFFFNNTQVMVLIFILSMLFGAGAVFILSWNASVIGVYTGLIVNSFMVKGLPAMNAYVFGVPVALASIALHGMHEILAYFFAGIAGGILSVGLLRERIGSRNFRMIFIDSLKFLVIAEVFIAAAAWLEVVF